MKHTALALILSAASVIAVSAQPKPVAIFVTSAGASDGLSDPNKDNQDTMKDLRDSLKGRKSIVLAPTREAADIVLVVMHREKAQMTAGPTTVFGTGPTRDVTVRIKFLYKDMETEMSGTANGGTMMSGGAWGKAAGKVAKQVEEWVEANKAKLMIDAR